MDSFTDLENDVVRLHHVWTVTTKAYEATTWGSAHEALVARQIAERAQAAYDAAVARLDAAVEAELPHLSLANTTPQSRRSLTAWADGRGPGEQLSEAVRQMVAAIEIGRHVQVTVI